MSSSPLNRVTQKCIATMENEQRHYGLRSGSRSRSQTPLIQNRALIEPETLEHHYDLRSHSKERSHTPGEVTNNRRSVSRMSLGSSSKTNDQSMETIAESKREVVVDASSEGESKKLENTWVGTKRVERRSERQKAKRQTFTNGQTDNKEDSFGRKSEKSRKSTSPRRIITSDYSSEEGEREDLSNRPNSAHEIYKQAGDWWNVFPKTDYTYSEQSQCRYEIAPGILAMPNMSRRSIHSDTSGTYDSFGKERKSETSVGKENEINTNICTSLDTVDSSRTSNSEAKSKIQYTKRHVEQYRSHREAVYAVPKNTINSQIRQSLGSASQSRSIHSQKYDVTRCADSDTELDEAVTSYRDREKKVTRYLTNFISIIVLWFNKLLEFLKLKAVKRREYRATYEYQRHESKWYKIWRLIDRCLQYVYLFLVKVFFFDSWLLSRVSSVRRWIHQRSPKIFWIALLPLLLLTGCWCLPYLSTVFLSTKVITQQLRETSELFATISKRSYLKGEEAFGKEDHAGSLGVKLNSKISDAEDSTVEQPDRLVNINRALEQLKESEYVWSRYGSEILSLEKKLEEHNRDTAELNTYTQKTVEEIKLQIETLKELYSKLEPCCNRNYITKEDLEKRVETILANYMVNKDFRDTIVAEEKKVGEKSTVVSSNFESDDRVREIVKEALRIYDADKTGRVDYALESAGGQIISTRCTQKYDIKTRAFKLLAFTLYHENNNPRTVIQGNPIQPGICWAFQGFPGYLLIKLRSSIFVSGFTLEHAAKSILPNGEMRSAPKKFNVWGFIDENDPAPVMFGDYEFVASDDNLQYFPVQNATIEGPYEYVELRIHSNHGQLEYTCLYRFRVHGKPA
ncbi:uncharacterized protein LOC100875464 isoform X1 [Megachile rotundata]|uniref:uncharacterized protein LOC100875464 isoform X1 n=2 Tax=Megachile rotundata TaxID=143995 RepID=UPI003FD14B86